VISGQNLITRIEKLEVNSKSRPIQDVLISNCGQLIRKRKNSEEEGEAGEGQKRSKSKKEKRRRRHSSSSRSGSSGSRERATVPVKEPEAFSTVKPEDLPEEPKGANRFLMRNTSPRPEQNGAGRQQAAARGTERVTKTGIKVKGRGAMRFRPEDGGFGGGGRAKSRSVTPPHWKMEEVSITIELLSLKPTY